MHVLDTIKSVTGFDALSYVDAGDLLSIEAIDLGAGDHAGGIRDDLMLISGWAENGATLRRPDHEPEHDVQWLC